MPQPDPAIRGLSTMLKNYVFTSESVSEGHPDKICDQMSDAILDAYLAQDKNARVACESLTKTGIAMVAGEIKVRKGVHIDSESIIRGVIRDIGYTSSDIGYDAETCAVINALGKQSMD